MKKIITTVEKYTLNRVTRIIFTLEPHIEYANKHFSKKAKETVEKHTTRLTILKSRLHALTAFKALLLLLLYASVMGTIFQNTFLSNAFNYAQIISGLIGSTALLLTYTLLSRLTNVYVSDAHTTASLLSSFIESEKRVKKIKKNN